MKRVQSTQFINSVMHIKMYLDVFCILFFQQYHLYIHVLAFDI